MRRRQKPDGGLRVFLAQPYRAQNMEGVRFFRQRLEQRAAMGCSAAKISRLEAANSRLKGLLRVSKACQIDIPPGIRRQA